MKGIRFLLASITVMVLALVGIVGGGQGIILTYISIPTSLILMFLGLCMDNQKQSRECQENKEKDSNKSK